MALCLLVLVFSFAAKLSLYQPNSTQIKSTCFEQDVATRSAGFCRCDGCAIRTASSPGVVGDAPIAVCPDVDVEPPSLYFSGLSER